MVHNVWVNKSFELIENEKALVEVAGYVGILIMGSRFSRRKCMIFCQTLAGVACLLSMILIEFISDYAEVNFFIWEKVSEFFNSISDRAIYFLRWKIGDFSVFWNVVFDYCWSLCCWSFNAASRVFTNSRTSWSYSSSIYHQVQGSTLSIRQTSSNKSWSMNHGRYLSL